MEIDFILLKLLSSNVDFTKRPFFCFVFCLFKQMNFTNQNLFQIKNSWWNKIHCYSYIFEKKRLWRCHWLFSCINFIYKYCKWYVIFEYLLVSGLSADFQNILAISIIYVTIYLFWLCLVINEIIDTDFYLTVLEEQLVAFIPSSIDKKSC